MKIAVFADTHFRGRDLDVAVEHFDACVTRAIDLGATKFMVAGDVFDTENIGDGYASTGKIVDAVSSLFDGASLIIAGNHDYKVAGRVPATRVLEGSGAEIVEEARWTTLHGVHVACLPWLHDCDAPTALAHLIDTAPQVASWQRRVLLAHVQVMGAVMAPGRTCDGSGRFSLTREQLDAAAAHFDRIFLGDFHRRQELVPGKGGYVGANRQLNFGEEGNPAGFELWDVETNQSEWVEVAVAPRHRTLRLAAVSPDTEVTAGANERLRVIAPNPTAEWVDRHEARGIVVEVEAVRVERQARIDPVPATVLDDPHAILQVWLAQQSPAPAEPEAIHAELDALLATKEATTP